MNDVFDTFPNYPKANDLDFASDRFVFKAVLFDDPGIKFAMLPEIIQDNPFISSVSYNGATNFFDIEINMDMLKKDPVYKDINMLDVISGIGASALQKVILYKSHLDELVAEKQKRTGMDYVSAYNYMVSYIEQPRLLRMFFRFFHYGNGKFAIEFI